QCGAEASTVLGAVSVDGGAFGESAVGDSEDIRLVFDDAHSEQFVFFTEFHAAHTGGGPAHGASGFVGGGEAQRLAFAGDQDQLVGAVDEFGCDDFVA